MDGFQWRTSLGWGWQFVPGASFKGGSGEHFELLQKSI